MALVTLTSIPSRFDLIGPTLEALVDQRGVDGVVLCLPQTYARFPDWDGTLPRVPAGVDILRVDQDLGPATKVLPAAQRYAGQGVRLLFCDDDRAYAPGWATGLLAEADRHPDHAVALAGWDIPALETRAQFATPRFQPRAKRWDMRYRMARLGQILRGQGRISLSGKPPRRIVAQAGFADILEGYGGVVVRPEFFDAESFNVPRVAFHVDDVWLSGSLARNGVGIWLAADLMEPKTTEADRQDALYRHRVADQGRAELDAAAIAHMQTAYGIWGSRP